MASAFPIRGHRGSGGYCSINWTKQQKSFALSVNADPLLVLCAPMQ